MAKKIVYIRTTPGDEGVSVVHLPDGDTRKLEDVAAAVVPAGLQYQLIEDTDIPPRDEYRNAWDLNIAAKKIQHNMGKARDIHKAHLRKLREPKLAALDIEYQKADEANDQQKKKDIAAKKQKLRDITAHPSIEAAQSVEELRAAALDQLE